MKVRAALQFVEDHPIINAFDALFASPALVEQLPSAFLHFGERDDRRVEKRFGAGEIDARFLLLRVDFEQDNVFGIGITDDRAPKQLNVVSIVQATERGSPDGWNNGKSFTHTAEQEQLKAEETGKCLQLEQAW